MLPCIAVATVVEQLAGEIQDWERRALEAAEHARRIQAETPDWSRLSGRKLRREATRMVARVSRAQARLDALSAERAALEERSAAFLATLDPARVAAAALELRATGLDPVARQLQTIAAAMKHTAQPHRGETRP